MSDKIKGALDFLRHAERLKDVLRSSHTSQGRTESTAEHTWRLCLMAMTLESELGEIDFARLLKIAVIHDLGEALHGDVPAPDAVHATDKAARERQDLQTLLAPLEPEVRQHFLALWDEYDQLTSREARLVKGLDKLETILQHNQGRNPADFDFAFNLNYGKGYTSAEPLLAAIRQLLDEDTQHQVLKQAAQALPKS